MQIINPEVLAGQSVFGVKGEKLGKVQEVYLDNETGRPDWAAVNTGMSGGHVSLVPLVTAKQSDNGLHVPFDEAQIKDAPHHDPGQHLSVQEEVELFEHYGVPYGGHTATAEPVGRPAPPADQIPPRTDDAMTRSEEQLRVGTEHREAGTARLRRYIVTEQVSQTVPVSHEEVRIERQPITDANRDASLDGAEISETEHEITLHEERPVVEKEVVAKERVRLSKETVAGQETVSGEVRKERIEHESSPQAGRSRNS